VRDLAHAKQQARVQDNMTDLVSQREPGSRVIKALKAVECRLIEHQLETLGLGSITREALSLDSLDMRLDWNRAAAEFDAQLIKQLKDG
jgi:hypothetical protein